MPDRPVWGMANDDSHQQGHIGLNTTVMLLPEHSGSAVRKALEAGAYYFTTVTSHPNNQRDPDGVPVIHGIRHDKQANTITIQADCGGQPLADEAFRWITAGGQECAQGPTIALNEAEGLSRYVRVQIRGTWGTAFTQPFGLRVIQQVGSGR